MDVLTAIDKRREITHFSPDPIPDEVLDKLVKSLYLSPSGNNLPSREFILVTKRETLKALTPTTPYMKWLENAAAAVIIIGNPDLSKYWLQDATLAGGYLWLTAASLGLGAAWGAVYHSEDPEESSRRESFVREQLAIPNHYRVVSIIGLGFPAKEPPAKEMYPLDRVFHREAYKRKE
ncbi:nitroreductase family protein [Bacillus methanolicus]|uniref:Nitroreductase n=1 Tax=Bacillus methanolicus (strain MGA3 / ATCC 53907) TaxID=796606 RepID=I3EBE5_BACMM|nr:nitroreductase family protein [Bacillus methanolicus]AIE61496.1 nitroreductase [Bacillus methanolicus MGA3]EIJ83816.1 nitroreductase [Bacillus methanolicus MGA3]